MSHVERWRRNAARLGLALLGYLVVSGETGFASPDNLPEASSSLDTTELSESSESRELGFRDVMRQRGPAIEKIEYESSRRVRWRYADYDVLFLNGRVRGGPDGVIESTSWGRAVPNPPLARVAGAQVVSPEAERIFNEILKEIPSGPDEPAEAGFPLPGGGSPSRVPGLVRPAPGIELSPQME